jgi:hypothetical protein
VFERLARPDLRPRSQQAAALLLSVVVNSTLFTALLVGGGQVVTEVQGQALAVEVTMVEAAAEGDARLPVWAPAPGGQAGEEEQAPAEAAPATASEEEAQPPGEEVTPKVEEGLGAGDGGATGAGGVGTGDGGGGGGPGQGAGGGGALVQTLAVEQVRPLRRVLPDFPASARALGLDSVRCVAEVEIDARGVPTRVQVTECPEIYRGAVQAAMLRWRFVPARVDGQPTPARFRQAIRFELRGG